MTQSSCPPLAAVPLGCPLCTDDQNAELKYFRAVAWITGVVEKDTLDGSDPPSQAIVSRDQSSTTQFAEIPQLKECLRLRQDIISAVESEQTL